MISTGTAPSASTPTARDPTVISSEKVSASAKSWVIVPRRRPEGPASWAGSPGAVTRTSSDVFVGVPAGSRS